MSKKTKIKKIRTKLTRKQLPKITHREEKSSSDFPLDHLSYSSMAKFSSNPILFRIKYINHDVIETAYSASMTLGNAFHHAIDVFLTSNKKDAVKLGLEAGIEFIEQYPEGFIKWNKTIENRQKMLEKFAFSYNSRVKELGIDGKLIDSEMKIEKYIDVDWRGKRISLPIKLKGYLDSLYRDKEKRLVIVDEKCCRSFSNPDKIDGRKMLQAIVYYFLVYAEYGEEPYKMRFVETKHTKSRDGVQTRAYDIIYSENELFFDFFLRFYGDVIKAIMGEQVFIPNVDTFMDNEVGIISYIQRLDEPDELAKVQKRLKVDNITEVLKKNLASFRNMKSLRNAVEKSLVEYKSINYSKMENHEKIITKLMEYGIVLRYDSCVKGNSFTQYRFTPSIGVKMRSLKSYTADIEQAIGMSGIRIVAPIPDTTFVGIELPKKKRTFVKLSDSIIGKKREGLPIGADQNGEIIRLTLDDMPHMLVAGATGSGKSVFLNSIIKSIIDQGKVSLKLIDPKMVELSQFADQADEIVYEPIEAANLLKSLIDETKVRYKILRSKKAKSYKEIGMKQIVCVIDEFADLIMSSKASGEEDSLDVERMITRLAQKGRAAGVHLIIATQRPDSNVVTGLIKANFPTKVAFATSSEINSRIILDESGAEKLLSKGDGLISSPKFNGLKRFQGYYL